MNKEQMMSVKEDQMRLKVQPQSYSGAELFKLREFIDVLKKDESRSSLVCWGNYSDYNHGW